MIQSILTSLIVNSAVFAALFAAMMLFRRLLAKKISAVMQYMLWAAVLIKLFVPFGFESSLSPLGWFALETGGSNPEAVFASPQFAKADDNAGQGSQAETANDAESAKETLAPVSGAPNTVQDTAVKDSSLSFSEWALIVWAAGGAAAVASMYLCAASLRRRARHAGLPVPERAARVFSVCKQEMGIRQSVAVFVQSALKAPLVMGSFQPMLILPEDIAARTDDQIRHICLHELAHVKYGDLAVITLMNVLRAVYWFNPLVWLCFKIVRKDMEAACDARVLCRIGASARQDYIGTVLNYAGREQEARLMAAMGMAEGRMPMEQRIRSMFRKTRTGRTVKIIALCVAALMLAMSVLSACQPTPEQEVIVNKGGNGLLDMIESSASGTSAASTAEIDGDAEAVMAALRESIGAPNTLADTYTNEKGDVTVTIDASVTVPAVQSIPALEATVNGFSQEQVDKLAEYFLKGAPVYTEEQARTKDEIMDELILMEQQDSAAVEGSGNAEYIRQLEQEYETAPDEKKRTPSTTQMEESEDGPTLNIVADLGKDGPASIMVTNSESCIYNDFRFYNDGKGDYDEYALDKESADANPRGMTTTCEDAEKIVMQCIAELGIGDMQIASARAGTYYENDSQRNDDTYKKTAKQCYVFTLERMVNSIPVLNIEAATPMSTDDPSVPAPEEPDYSMVTDPERLIVCVDDTGIVRFSWHNPSQISSVMSQNVTLKPFDEVVQRAKDNMFYQNYTAYGSTAEIKITSVRLSMMRIMQKDSPGKYLLIPVWDFIGNQKNDFGNHDEWLPFGDQSYVTINAIDGSSINRSWGY